VNDVSHLKANAISYFSQWMLKGSLGQKEIENSNQDLATFWELVEVECEENPEVMLTLYEMLKEERNWDEEALCRKLEISEEVSEGIKSRRRPGSGGFGLRMLYELFAQVAVYP